MQSAKNSESIVFNAYTDTMPYCCGVGMIVSHVWKKWKWAKGYDTWTKRWFKYRKYTVLTTVDISDKKMSCALFKCVKIALQQYSLVYVALPQNTPVYKQVTKWYLAHHFKKENETTSNHGKYKIFVLSITKEEWKKHYAL